jgi:tetratricopeptide (TPR) repeat protein
MRGRDYFRAISTYKELAFFSTNKDSTAYYYSQIGKAYRLSQKYEFSIATYSDLLNNYKLADSITSSIYLNLGLNYLGMNVPSQAFMYFNESIKTDKGQLPLFYLGLASVEISDWAGAQSYYNQTSKLSPDSKLGILSSAFSTKIQDVDKIPHKNPALACLFSVVIPGSGQLYCAHYVDALQSFAFVSVFSFASCLAYQHDKVKNSTYLLTGISLSITALFHLANIIGAERTASYYNQRQRELFIQDIRDQSYNIDK